MDAHLRHLGTWDLDFLKVMNDTGFPRPEKGWVARSAADLADLPELDGTEPEFEAEYEVIRSVAERLQGDVLTTVTLFNAWTTLRRLCAPRSDTHRPPSLGVFDERDQVITEMLREDRAVVADALQRIGRALARFAAGAIQAGADGVFLSVRDDWVDVPQNGTGAYRELVQATDLEILQGASRGRLNILHVCGKPLDFDRFAEYPVHAINWADKYAGPRISEVVHRAKPAICGGLDNLNTLPNGTPDECAEQVRDALRDAGGRPIIISPGCTYDPAAVPDANLQAIAGAVREVA